MKIADIICKATKVTPDIEVAILLDAITESEVLTVMNAPGPNLGQVVFQPYDRQILTGKIYVICIKIIP